MTNTERIAVLEAEVTQLRTLVADLLTVAVTHGDMPLTSVRLIAELRAP
jgi:hypothetical protein